jgi:ferredoxin--NADP+ reductase
VQASFTTKELRELGELEEADIRLDAHDLVLDPTSEAQLSENKVAARNLKVMEEWTQRDSREDVHTTIEVKFFRRPTALHGSDRVVGLEVERTQLDADGRLVGSGETEELAVDLVVRSVGYQGTAMPGVPFDPDRNVIPNVDGRVVDGDGVVRGLYVAGWIKRGPTGIIGTNKKCAVGTVSALLADVDEGLISANGPAPGIDSLLQARGVQTVDTSGWRSIDDQEKARGGAQGRPRVTIHERDELVQIGSAATPTG